MHVRRVDVYWAATTKGEAIGSYPRIIENREVAGQIDCDRSAIGKLKKRREESWPLAIRRMKVAC